MKSYDAFKGIIPAFYACYDEEGEFSAARTAGLAEWLIQEGVNGLYVGGSSGECIYQDVEEREKQLETVVRTVAGRIPVIAHVGCNNTRDSQRLARHAESLGVQAIASIPPIYFHLPEAAIARYWNDISAAAPNTDFIIYNIPQLAGTALTVGLLKRMRENPRVAGVKNSSLPVQDIQMFRAAAGKDFIVFNGPDEQLLSGLAAGAKAGIGGTYAVMPRLYLAIYDAYRKGEMEKGLNLQDRACAIIYKMLEAEGNLYAVMKAILAREGVECGSVRAPLPPLTAEDGRIAEEACRMIHEAYESL